MSTRKILLFLFTALLFLNACKPANEKLSESISQSERELFSDSSLVPDTAKATETISLYLSYVEQFPNDTASPDYLFRAADLSSKTNQVHAAVKLFGKLVKDYPSHRHVPVSIFLQGFIYENQAGEPMKAKPYYEEFLKKYPDHPMAADVAFSLENLGKTPEELIREFESNALAGQQNTAADTTMVP